jgi:prevent-host-death family protein
MTKTAEAGELAKHLTKFLDEVRAGNEVLVTSGDKPVARLVPVQSQSRPRRRSIRSLRPLSGKWTGETVLKSGDLADEMFARE